MVSANVQTHWHICNSAREVAVAHIERWSVGTATITSVVEEQTDHIPPEFFLPEANGRAVLAHDWVRPFVDHGGAIGLRVQSFVVLTGSLTFLVDTCVGNGKSRTLPFWDQGDWPWLERLAAVGVAPADVDVVIHTHTHVDHVGWDTTWVDGTWAPTFPNARYLYAEGALEWADDNDDPGMPGVYEDSLASVITAELADVVADDEDLGHGISLVPAPGHTPGHVAVSIVCDGDTALITGDFVHHPVQFAEPQWREIGDVDPDTASETRLQLLRELGDSGTLVLGSHFPNAPAGYVVTDGDRWRFLTLTGTALDGSP